MALNKILAFAATDTGTNLLTDTEYAADGQRTIGVQPGVARSKLQNKTLRQTALMSAGLAQFAADNQASDLIDTLTPAQISAILGKALAGATPHMLRVITATGNFTALADGWYDVWQWGGGGGGGGIGTISNGGAGGGGGGSFSRSIIFLTAGQVVTCTIGAAGAAGGVGGAGGAGTATSFGAFMTSPGGSGGGVGGAGSGNGGSGGAAGTGGTINLAGASGSAGAPGTGAGGVGGGAFFSPGAGAGSGVSESGLLPGAGGAGHGAASTGSGGTGAAGQIWIKGY